MPATHTGKLLARLRQKKNNNDSGGGQQHHRRGSKRDFLAQAEISRLHIK